MRHIVAEATIEAGLAASVKGITHNTSCDVTAIMQDLRQGGEVFFHRHGPIGGGLVGIASREHRGVRSKSEWGGGNRLVENHPTLSPPFEVWGGFVGVTIEAHAFRTKGVKNDEQDVGSARRSGRKTREQTVFGPPFRRL